MTEKLRVGILGATGIVGQRLIQLLARHAQFVVTAVAASERSQRRLFSQACTWRLSGDVPPDVATLTVEPPEPPLDCDLVLSSLPTDTARDVEPRFAAAGYPVISNSSAYRMERGIPLLVPEVNADHAALVEIQGSRGYIVTNPNCSAVIVALALAPLYERFGVEAVAVTTMQALSGAGYPGAAALDVADNVIPYIAQEEEKLESEMPKILGRLRGGWVEPAGFAVSAQCNRVNVLDGHLAAVRVRLAGRPQLAEVRAALSEFRGRAEARGLFSAPERPIIVRDEADRPQPRLDRGAGRGMSVTVGRLARDRVLDYRFVVLGHNTIRGAAGAAILNAELLQRLGYLSPETQAPHHAEAAR